MTWEDQSRGTAAAGLGPNVAVILVCHNGQRWLPTVIDALPAALLPKPEPEQGSGGSILASEPSGETSSAAPLPSETPIKRGRRTSTATPGRRITSLSIFPSQAELHDRIARITSSRAVSGKDRPSQADADDSVPYPSASWQAPRAGSSSGTGHDGATIEASWRSPVPAFMP